MPLQTDANYLVGLTGECSDCGGQGSWTVITGKTRQCGRCLSCKGSGHKPVFPTLRRDCTRCKGKKYEIVGGPLLKYADLEVLEELPDYQFKVKCTGCQGLGYVPVVDMDTALVAAWPKLNGDQQDDVVFAIQGALDEQKNPTEAVYAAIRQVMEAKYGR